MSIYQDVKSLLWRKERQLRLTARGFLLEYPVYLSIARRRRPDKVIGEDTELVIEGFPRSGNTFAVTAFQLAQSRPVKIASHLHASSHVIAAVKRHIPTLVLLRDPVDAITSYVIFWNSDATVKQAFRYYVRFYTSILPYQDQFVIASFDNTVTDFGGVIRSVNERFGTHFDEFQHTEDNVKRCFDLIEEEMVGRRGLINEPSIPRPSGYRREIKEELRAQVCAEHLASLRAEAYAVYEKCMQGVVV